MEFSIGARIDIYALVIGVFNSVFLYLGRRSKIKQEKIKAHEEIIESVKFLYSYGYRKRKPEVDNLQYHNEDPEIQKMVREYLEMHWLEQMNAHRPFLRDAVRGDTGKFKLSRIIQEEAHQFEMEKLSFSHDVSLPMRSPVYYLDDEEVKRHWNEVKRHVGKNLSVFSETVQIHWRSLITAEPKDVIREYEKSLRACENYFDHNSRGFDDPFMDLIQVLNGDYNSIRESWFRELKWKIHTKTRWVREGIYIAKTPLRKFRKWRLDRKLKMIVNDARKESAKKKHRLRR